jgi:hypothetical protein
MANLDDLIELEDVEQTEETNELIGSHLVVLEQKPARLDQIAEIKAGDGLTSFREDDSSSYYDSEVEQESADDKDGAEEF